MNEINLELERNSHKTFNVSNSAPNTSGVNILRESPTSKNSDIGLDLLINKSKIGGDGRKSPVEEFRPSEPITPKTTPPMFGSASNSNISSTPCTEISLDKEINLNDIGSTDVPNIGSNITSVDLSTTSFNTPPTLSPTIEPVKNITSTVDLGSSNNLKDLDLNLDSLLGDNNSSSSPFATEVNLGGTNTDNPGTPVQRGTSPPLVKKSFEELQKEKAEFIRLLERMERRGLSAHKKFTMDSD